MLNFFRYRLNLRIFAIFIVAIFTTTFSSSLIGYRVILKTAEYEIQSKLNDSISAYYQEIKFTEQNCLSIAKTLSKNRDIVTLLSNKKYKQLEKKLIEYYRMKIADIIEIENTEGQVVLRGHNPSLAGDIKIEQKIIQRGLSGVSNVSYEIGKSGFAIRAVSPIKINPSGSNTNGSVNREKIIGLLMIGARFSKKFANHIRLLTGMDNGIYRGGEKIISTYKGLEHLDKKTLAVLKDNKTCFIKNTLLNNKISYVLLKPLFVTGHQFWGAICIGASHASESKYLRFYRSLLLFLILVGVGLSLALYFLLAKNINESLKKITDAIDGFKVGEYSNTIQLKGKDEFTKIADSFNNLVRKLKLYDEQINKLQEEMIQSAKLATAGQIAAGLAHEIRNPLSSIKMMSQILKHRLANNNREEISTILRETERINSIVKELIEFAKPSKMHFQESNLTHLIESVLNLFKYRMEHQKIQVKLKIAEDLPTIKVDEEKIRIALINLVTNAIQAMPGGGELKVESRKANQENVFIKICDTGIGIEKKDLQNIFEPFFTTKREGTGLGLALTKTIIERHMGQILVESKRGDTCFTIILPINLKNKLLILR